MNTVLIQRIQSPNGNRVQHAKGKSSEYSKRLEGSRIRDMLPKG